MSNHPEIEPAIGYRILDLTEGGCMIGARTLADLGADVIKIEPPGGSPSRIAPYYKNIPHPEKSLFWFAYNMNKRGITLDITTADGQEIFRRLVKSADGVIESYAPGYMSRLSLGYDDLCRTKPDIIVTSITPFGQNGPKAGYTGSDLTAWASGAYLYMGGDPDRAPTWISFPQALLHGGAEGASGTMAALWHRRRTGEGQQVDVSIQECVIACTFNAPEMWDLNQVDVTRLSQKNFIGAKGVKVNAVWRCKDGYVRLLIQGGVQPFASSTRTLVKWMDDEGMADDWLKSIDWAEGYDASKLTQDIVNRVEAAIAKFLLTKTKMELYYDGALKRRIMLGMVSTTRDVWESAQLKSRDYWVPVEHPELDDRLTYPGASVRLSKNQIKYRQRAPLIGEHNIEVYQKELGFTRADLIMLKQAAII